MNAVPAQPLEAPHRGLGFRVQVGEMPQEKPFDWEGATLCTSDCDPPCSVSGAFCPARSRESVLDVGSRGACCTGAPG